MNDKIKVNFKIKLTKTQEKAYEYLHDKDTRVLVCVWSRQSGKSVLCELALIEQLLTKNKMSAYISPSFSLGRKVYGEIYKLLEPTGFIKKANASTLTIETVFNSTLQFFSAESPTSIRGFTVSGFLVLDEMAFYPDILPSGEDFMNNIVLPLTKARNPKILCVSTPCGKRGCFYDYYLRALRKDKGYRLIESNIYSDSLITEEQIEELKRTMPDLAFRQEFLIQFLDSAVTFFNGFENCFEHIPRYTYNKTFIGVDLSGEGKDETIVTKINEKNQVEQFVIEGTLDQKYKKIADIINSSDNLQCALLENNGLGSPMINEIRKLVKHKSKIAEWTTTNNTKTEIVSNLAVAIANKDIHFNSEDKQLFAQFGTFICKFTKNGRMQFEAMDGKKDDRIMSLCIALECKNTRKPISRDNFQFITTNYRNIN